jgi:hypothetical protein
MIRALNTMALRPVIDALYPFEKKSSRRFSSRRVAGFLARSALSADAPSYVCHVERKELSRMHPGLLAVSLSVCSTAGVGGAPKQATLGPRSEPLLTVDGLTFKDLQSKTGSSIPTRTGDCLRRSGSPTWCGA